MSVEPPSSVTDNRTNRFGTFGGVFTPSILTILGVIMFMRTGFVVGQAGILSALLILLAAEAIALFTGLSISAISTNTKVEGGGAYFLISRSLGPGYGGAIGLALFLAQALSVPFYVLGFTEAVTTSIPALSGYFLPIGLLTTVGIFGLNWGGAGWAIRAQYLILAVLVASVVVMLGGAIDDASMAGLRENWAPEYTDGANFWIIFAVFFPAVTGIMAGVNMSGDLDDPAKSIPRGTLAAILVGLLVYGAQVVITGAAFSRAELVDRPYESLMDHALFGMAPIVAAGVLAATLSSAIGSFLGAPRILQALARDDIFPLLRPFAKGTTQGDEPRRGYTLTFVMTIAVLFAGGDGKGGGALNAVAAVLTMFFLYTYGMTNMAAFIEHFGRNPSFRPRFQFFHWGSALVGALGCIAAALLINPLAAIVSFFLILLAFAYTETRALTTTFGDARRGFLFSRVRTHLLKLAALPTDPKNWRPTTLLLTSNPATRLTLARYAVWLENGRGVVTIAHVLTGEFHEMIRRRRAALDELRDFIEDQNLQVFPEVIGTSDFETGSQTLLQSHSIGPLKPNVLMMGWPKRVEYAAPFWRLLHLAEELSMSQIAVFDHGLPSNDETDRRVDIWWRGKENGSLMLILAYLLTHNWRWGNATIRVLRQVAPGASVGDAAAELDALIVAARIEARSFVVEEESVADAIHAHSHDATVVFLGFNPPEKIDAAAFHEHYTELVEGLPTTLLVSSSGEANVFA